MNIFKFTEEVWDDYNPSYRYNTGPRYRVQVECEEVQLEEVLGRFTEFLRGCGFHIDGHLEIVKGDE